MRGLSILIKPASGNCNMRCKYCFYANVTQNRVIANRGMMNDATLASLVKKAFEECTDFCSFAFQGGEPTLAGLPFFERFVELQNIYNTNHIQVANAIQTNGFNISKPMAEFFAKHNFLVGLSIDGQKDTHNFLRIDANNQGTFTQCMKTAHLLTACHVEYNILCVVTKQVAEHPRQVYSFYKKNNFRYVQFIPCINDFGKESKNDLFSLSSEAFGEFLCTIFDLWHEDFVKGDYVSIRTFDNYIHMLMGQPPENCAMNGVCAAYPVIEADGSVYPCDFYVLDEYCLGNINLHGFSEMLKNQTAQAFRQTSTYVSEPCLHCEYAFICRGGCRRDREPMENNHLSLNRYCSSYKLFFKHSLARMKQLAHAVYRNQERTTNTNPD